MQQERLIHFSSSYVETLSLQHRSVLKSNTFHDFNEGNLTDSKCSLIKVVKKTRFPRWNEKFTFEFRKPLDPLMKILFVCTDWDRISHNDFMGQVGDVYIEVS